jgi:chromosome segregation ATPase
MANKNKKIKSLVMAPDDDPTAEFEIIPTLTQRIRVPNSILEVDEDTFDVNRATSKIGATSKSDLERSLAESAQKIEELDFQLEHARSRQRGLEKELEVREEITENISRELSAVRLQVQEAVSEEEVARLKAELAQKQTESDKLAAQIESLSDDNRQLKETLRRDVNQDIQAFQNRIARQEGELAARAQELARLEKDNTRFEDYANSLRLQLQDQILDAKVSTTMRQNLEDSLEETRAKNDHLSHELELARGLNEKLTEEIRTLKIEFEREARQIRFELSSAQETLADQESINEQLASDLIDNRGFRQALESHVGEIEKENEERIQELTKQLKVARREAEDYESKLRIKDAAITDLMKELASRSSNVELRDDIDSVLKKVDGFRPDARGSTPGIARDKVACLLIDNADGRELRFPLFKDRLTIGRTSHNDIQLDLRFVSRRHAVISNDCGKTRVIDWGSKNGVFVNKIRVAEKILSPGDIVTIGTTEMRYEERSKR